MSSECRRAWLAVLVLACAAAVTNGSHRAAAQGGTVLHGRVKLMLPGGKTQPAQDAVIWIGDGGSGAAPHSDASGTRASMASSGKRFLPHVLAVRSGERVDFPNVDRIFHNAFSVSPGNQFDLGLYRKGASKSMTFTTPGVVRVYCNIHQDMAGYVLVLPAAGTRAVVTGADGAFRFEDPRPGRQTIKVWHPMAGEIEAAIDIPAGAAREWDVELDASRFRATTHKNKHGKDYPPMRKDADRY